MSNDEFPRGMFSGFLARCPKGHELYLPSVASDAPFCPVCKWTGKGSLLTPKGKRYWVNSKKRVKGRMKRVVN